MDNFPVERPRLRPLELKWLDDGGRSVLYMRDPSGIAPSVAIVPPFVAVLLGFCDGERDLAAIRAAFELRTGQPITLDQVRNVIQQLDEALFLDSPRFEAVKQQALEEYRSAAQRPPALVDRVYPGDPSELIAEFARYEAAAPADGQSRNGNLRGVISPHIDYQRGGPIYAATWRRAAVAVQEAELVIIFGTDHSGGLGKVTLTRQSYATPFGVLPTAVEVVDAVAEAIGPDDAFAEEIHHRKEHSIELVTVWLHWMRTGAPPSVVPILCGSFYAFTEGEADPETDERFARMLDALRSVTDGRRVLVVAAADLAHVGPAFGDPRPYREDDRSRLATKDEQLLGAICDGNAAEFFGQLRAERDARRICGLPPIYLTLRFLGDARGEVVGYDQCPADAQGGSLVSISGVVLE